jgi:DNA-directed RNA polymerase subunit M/transcription elongation factor TFIIS
MVKFCPQCNNLYGHAVDEQTLKLRYVCPSCGNTENVIDRCIVINELNTNTQDYQLNANMIYDLTYPRTKKIPCPNPDCPSVQLNENPEIIVFQYNPTMLKTGYMCTDCNTYWKN